MCVNMYLYMSVCVRLVVCVYIVVCVPVCVDVVCISFVFDVFMY